MTSLSMTGLDEIVSSRVKKDTVIGGEYIAFIGGWMILTYLFNMFVVSNWWVWLASIALGWIAILAGEKWRAKKEGHYSTRIQSEIFSIWILIGGFAAPMILYVFPALFKLYPGTAITPLMYFLCGIGIWLTGVVSRGKEFKLGALCLFAGSLLASFYTTVYVQLFIFLSVMVTGFVIPGIVSKRNESK